MSKDNFMLRKIATAAGAVVGVGTALWIAIFLPFEHERETPALVFSLFVATVCGVKLMLYSHLRPLGTAYDLGYESARRDAIREANRRGGATGRREEMGLTFTLEQAQRRRVNGHEKTRV
jgi:hypothetical protein